MASLRRRRPAAHRAKSTTAAHSLAPSSPDSAMPSTFSPSSSPTHITSSDSLLPPPASPDALSTSRLRGRSHSLYGSSPSLFFSPFSSFSSAPAHPFPRTRAALQYGSELLESLDLGGDGGFLGGVREYLLEKLDRAERGLGALREIVESEEEWEGDAHVEEDTDDEGAGRFGRSTVTRAPPLSPAGQGTEDQNSVEHATFEDDLTTLSTFISSASSFLSALRAELPSLALPSSSTSAASPLVAFHLSHDAREALDRFLADHPLPSLPQVRARAASGANAVLARVASEVEALRETMAYLTSSTTPTEGGEGGQQTPSAFEGMAAYFPTMPSPSSVSASMPDLHSLRTYFTSESARLSSSLSALKSETTTSLSHLSSDLAHAAHDALDEAKKMYHAALEAGKTRLLRYEELPDEWRNNEHIHHGYRYIPIENWGRLLRSGVEWHNETVNVQSHFLGFLSLCALLVHYLFFRATSPHVLVSPHPGDTAIAVLFVVSAMHCLLCSATWHLLSGCATDRWFRGAACVDYVGISGLIAASVMGAEYYGFYSRPTLATSYMIFSAVVGVAGMIVPWQAWFNQREHKMWRVAFFCSLAASAVAPIAHRSAIYGVASTFWFYSSAVPSVAAYLVGLIFYSNQFPECCRPGSWNFGASHNWWHFSIVAAIYLHWKAMGDWSAIVALADLAGVDSGVALGAH
ncbi:hypothetical protein JCM11251_002935 [Rhodosporidiobolus azoricus]